MGNTPTYSVTLVEFMTSVINALRNNSGQTNTLGQGPSKNIINFMVAWAHQEGGSVTNSAHFNPLNTMQQETGSVVFGTTQAGTGVQAYPDATTGEKATEDALNNGSYGALVNALTTNDETSLGFTVRGAPSFSHMMSKNVAQDLAIWLSGSGTIDSTSESYILSVMHGAGIPNPVVEGGSQQGSQAGNPQGTIDQWGAVSIGMSQTGTGNNTSSWTQNDILKVGGGVLLILIAVALFIKVQVPGSPIARFIPGGKQ